MLFSRHWKLFAAILFAFAWWVLFDFLLASMPVGLVFSPGQVGEAGLIVSSERNRHVERWQTIPQGGGVSFNVPCLGQKFAFGLKSSPTGTFNLEGVSLFGLVVLDSSQISRFQMVPKLYREIPERGEPLVLHVQESTAFDLPNVFAYILKFMRLMQKVVPLLGVLLLGLVFLYALLKRVWKRCFPLLSAKPGICLCALMALVLLSLPKPVWPALPGLDDSWEWLFNYVAFAGEVGKRMVFTYGPLGFLIHPELCLRNVLCGLFVNAGFLAVYSVCVWHLYRSGRCVSAFLLMVCFAFPWPNQMEWKWCAISLIACAIPCVDRGCGKRSRHWLFLAAALFAVLQTYVKFSSFISVVSTHAMLLAFFAFQGRNNYKEIALWYAFPLMLAFCGFGLCLFENIPSFLNWFAGSVEIARGYNDYMVVDKSLVELSYPLILAALGGIALFLGNGSRWKRIGFYVLISPILFCTLKYAWIRQGPVPFCMLVATLSCLLPVWMMDSERQASAVCGLSLLFAIASAFLWGGMDGASGLSLANLRDSLMPVSALQREQEASRCACAAHRLPDSWRKRIGKSTVMFAGYGFGAAMIDAYNLVPFPATQLYSAYTPWLDEWCAEAVTTEGIAPRFLLVSSDPCSFFYQNVFLDNPQFWSAVCSHYQYVDSTDEYVFLERRSVKRKAPVRMPVSIQVDKTPFSRLQSLLFRPVRHWATIEFSDGQQQSFAVNPKMLKNLGTFLGIPRTRAEMERCLRASCSEFITHKIKFYSTEF